MELRFSGLVRGPEIAEAFAAYATISQFYKGKPHMLIADMRGMAPLPPELAEKMMEAIAYGREHGVVFCVHLSDTGIVRLQSRRLAAEADPRGHGTMVEVDSLEEAWRQIDARELSKAS